MIKLKIALVLTINLFIVLNSSLGLAEAPASFRQYYNVFDLEGFPPQERERILQAVLHASSFEEALEITSQTVAVYILDEENARQYGEKYVLPAPIIEPLDEYFPQWQTRDFSAYFGIIGNVSFMILKNTESNPFGPLVHELIHRLIPRIKVAINKGLEPHVDVTTVLSTTNPRKPKQTAERINKLIASVEEFIVFNIEMQYRRSFRVRERFCPNHTEFHNLAEIITQLMAENKLDKETIKEIILTYINEVRTALPDSLPQGNPITFGIEKAELHILLWDFINDPIYEEISRDVQKLKIVLEDIGLAEFPRTERVVEAGKRAQERSGLARERRRAEAIEESCERSGNETETPKSRRLVDIHFKTYRGSSAHR